MVVGSAPARCRQATEGTQRGTSGLQFGRARSSQGRGGEGTPGSGGTAKASRPESPAYVGECTAVFVGASGIQREAAGCETSQ